METKLSNILRGPFVSRFLMSAGINPRHFWVLMDLFGQLSERHEFMNQLGRSGWELKGMALLYFVFSVFFSLVFLFLRIPVTWCLAGSLLLTALFLLTLLVSETNNSLVNPVEGLVLAHQPIDGATYTAAKLTHLGRILLYVIPALNGVPALASLWLPQSIWFYPLLHLVAAFALGLMIALFCCSLFGWLIRFVPAPRLKAIGNWTELIAWLAFPVLPQAARFLRHINFSIWLPAPGAPRWALGIAATVLVAGCAVFGLSSLSVDYMIRVSSIVHGGSGAKGRPGRWGTSGGTAGLLGGQLGRAGFEFVSQMMARDWAFLRQTVALVPLLIMAGVTMFPGLRITPFSGHFTPLHVLPHVFGFMLFLVCSALAYSNDCKGAWVFLLVPSRSFERFASGIFALLWLAFLAIPHLFLFAVLTWFWGIQPAAIFLAYSLAVASFYLSLEIRLVESVPFSQQPRASQSAMLLPIMVVGGLGAALGVAVQYFFIFPSIAITMTATATVAIAAFFLTRRSLRSVGASMRFNLGRLSSETTFLYQEIGG